MLDDILEAVGAPCEPDRENADALLLPNLMQQRASVLLNDALSGSVFVLAIKRADWRWPPL